MNRIESLEFPNTIATCYDRIQALSAELTAARVRIEELEGQNRALHEKVRDLMHRLFGKKGYLQSRVEWPLSSSQVIRPVLCKIWLVRPSE